MLFYQKFYQEIKSRLIIIIFAWSFSFIAGYTHKEIILFHLTTLAESMKHSYFIFTNVTELLSTYVELVTFISTQITLFVTIYQSLMFLSTGLYRFELDKLKFLFKLFSSNWSISIMILHLLVIPISWEFFLGFQNNSNKLYSIDIFFEAKLIEYVKFVIESYYICLISCQFLLILLIITTIFNNQSYNQIIAFRKFLYLMLTIFSTIVTPPDVFSQISLSLLLIVLYELVFLLTRIFTTVEAN